MLEALGLVPSTRKGEKNLKPTTMRKGQREEK
jgi:hypothetical protein